MAFAIASNVSIAECFLCFDFVNRHRLRSKSLAVPARIAQRCKHSSSRLSSPETACMSCQWCRIISWTIGSFELKYCAIVAIIRSARFASLVPLRWQKRGTPAPVSRESVSIHLSGLRSGGWLSRVPFRGNRHIHELAPPFACPTMPRSIARGSLGSLGLANMDASGVPLDRSTTFA